MAESGSGILSPRLSPNPSPNPSPAAVEIPDPLATRVNHLAPLPRVDEASYPTETVDSTDPSSQVITDTSDGYFDDTSHDSTPTGNSPLRPEGPDTPILSPAGPLLQITSPDQSDMEEDMVMVDHDMAQIDEDQQQAMFLDDEGLTALEKIYLFSRSSFTFHRTYISKQLPYLIREVSPAEAVEYVCPLLNGLGTDVGQSLFHRRFVGDI